MDKDSPYYRMTADKNPLVPRGQRTACRMKERAVGRVAKVSPPGPGGWCYEMVLKKDVTYTHMTRSGRTTEVIVKKGTVIRFTASYTPRYGVFEAHWATVYGKDGLGRTQCVANSGNANLEAYSPKELACIVLNRILEVYAGTTVSPALQENIIVSVESHR